MDEFNVEPLESEKGKFNGALALVYRVHVLKSRIIDARSNGMIQDWLTYLLCIREELHGKMLDTEKEYADKIEMALLPFEKAYCGKRTAPLDIVQQIISYERLLSCISVRLGLEHIPKQKDDLRFAMGN